jgi:LytR cell envelope-related transcriptional attenuator
MVKVELEPKGPRSPERVGNALLAGIGVAVGLIVIVALARMQAGHSGPQSHSGRAAVTGARQSPTVMAPAQPAVTQPASSQAAPAAGSPSAGTPLSPAPSVVRPAAPATVRPAPKQPLIVLNNTTISGLARAAQQRLQRGGWTVTAVGNIRNGIVSTCAYYDPANPNARAAAQTLMAQFPAIKRVKERFAQLPRGPIVLVLTGALS